MYKYENLKEIREVLYKLDYMCKRDNIKAKLLLLGGSAILVLLELLGEKFRSTLDIDVDIISTNDYDKLGDNLRKLGIHSIGGVIELPPREDLIQEQNKYKVDGAGFEAIEVYVPTLELLACTKIFSTRGKDLEDLKSTSLIDLCDREKLLNMVNEYKEYLLNPSNMNLNVHELENIFKQKGYRMKEY